jgi:hypothetical protein
MSLVACFARVLRVVDAASAHRHAQLPPLLIPPALNPPQRQEFQMGRTAHTRGRFADSTRAYSARWVFSDSSSPTLDYASIHHQGKPFHEFHYLEAFAACMRRHPKVHYTLALVL